MTVTVVLAHQGGWDEFAFVLLPLFVFLTLQWLNRRKLRKQEEEGAGMTNRPPRRKQEGEDGGANSS